MRWALLALILSSPVSAESLRVMTYNLRFANGQDSGLGRGWDKRKDLIAEKIQKNQVDLLGTQESTPRMTTDLSDLLGKSSSLFKWMGVPRTNISPEGVPIFYRTALLEADPDDGGTFWLSDEPHRMGSNTFGGKQPRIVTWSRFTLKKSGKGFYFYNLHLDHVPAARLKSVDLLIEMIQKRKRSDNPVIVVGDFNASEKDPSIKKLSSFLKNAYRTKHPKGPAPLTFHKFEGKGSKHKYARYIDYIFISPALKVMTTNVITENKPPFSSDHFPVISEISLDEAP